MLVNFTMYHNITSAIQAGLYESLGGSINYIEIYSGTMPDDADDWVQGGPGSPSELLVKFNGFTIDNTDTSPPRLASVQSVQFNVTFKPSPNPVNATATGTAAWYAMYSTAGGTNGPIIGDVTATGGTGTLRLDSISLVSGNPVTITHFGFILQT